MKIFRVLAVGVFLVGLASSVTAAEDETFRFFEEEAVVVSAAKHPQKISDAPASAYIITAEEIERYGYRTLAEALQSVPGIYVTNDRNYSFIWFRGFGRPSDYNSRVLTLVNGHRINDNLYGFTSPDHVFSIDMKSVERIEVIEGPGSALYGDNALLGTINVITKTPSDAAEAQVNSEAGSFGTRKEFASVARRFRNGASLYIAGSERRMQGQDLFYPEFSAINNGIAHDADGEKDYDLYFNLAYAGFVLQGTGGGRTKQIPTGSWGTRFNDPGNRTGDSLGFVELKTERNPKEGIQLVARAYYDWYHYRADLLYDNATPPPLVIVNKDIGREKWIGEEIRGRFDIFGPENAFTLGQDLEKNLEGWQLNYNADPFSVLVDDDRRPLRWALFAQQELRPYPALGLTAGVRYDAYESFGKTVNPRLAAVYRLGSKDTLKLLYGSAFRAPTPYEMFWADFATAKPNPNLQPEQIRTHEVRWEREVPGHGNVRIGYYHSRTGA